MERLRSVEKGRQAPSSELGSRRVAGTERSAAPVFPVLGRRLGSAPATPENVIATLLDKSVVPPDTAASRGRR